MLGRLHFHKCLDLPTLILIAPQNHTMQLSRYIQETAVEAQNRLRLTERSITNRDSIIARQKEENVRFEAVKKELVHNHHFWVLWALVS